MAKQMSEWTTVITHPLGIVGFVLFLVFGLLAKVKRRDERRWLVPAAIVLAVSSLVGGLTLAYVQMRGSRVAVPQNPAPVSSQQQTNQVQQTSSGAGSPNVQGVQGDVTVTVDQSSGKTEASKAQKNKPQRKKVP